MNVKPTESQFHLKRGCYIGLKIKSSGHSIPANGQKFSFLRDNFSGLTPDLLNLLPWKDRTFAGKIKPADEGFVKAPTFLLSIGLENVKPNDPVTLSMLNGYMGMIPSTFDQLQDVMSECFSLSENSVIKKIDAGTLHYAFSDCIAKERGVLSWLDEFRDDPGCLSVLFRVQLFRGSTLDWLSVYLPLKNVEIVDYFKTQDIPVSN